MKQYCSFLIFCLVIFFFTSCKETPKEGPALLVGTNRVLDQNIPFPFLVERDSDSIYLINHRNQIIDAAASKASAYAAGDTLQMKTHSFFFIVDEPDFFVFDLKDSVAFPYAHYKYGARLKAVAGKPLLPLPDVKENLIGKIFKGDIQSHTPNRDLEVIKHWKFSEDSLRTVFSYYYKDSLLYQEQQKKKYHLFERLGRLFFSENEVPENPQMLYQITAVDGDGFAIQYYRNNEKIEEDYRISEDISLFAEIPFFSNCLDGQPGEYYHDDITYLYGNDYLVRKIAAKAPLDQGDGYITVHFTINCRGQVGRLGLEQMDRNFKETSFSPALVHHLVSEVVQLQEWPEIEPSHFFKDVHAFLMFKIEDGKITDLCP